MKFGYTILYVASVEDTLAFYERAFGLTRGMVTEGGEYGELRTGDTTLAFAANTFIRAQHAFGFEDADPRRAAPAMEIALVTEEVETAFARAVTAGATELESPKQKPWGQLVGYVRDNNGFLVEICSPIGG